MAFLSQESVICSVLTRMTKTRVCDYELSIWLYLEIGDYGFMI
jgi:hypothetical protein